MKTFHSILFILLFGSFVFAQDSTWQYGYQFGANLSSFTGNNPYGEQYSNFGLNFGVYFKYRLSDFSKIYAEIRYISKGARWGCTWIPISDCDGDVRNYDISYLQIPIYYSASVMRFDDQAELLALQVGPYFSYPLSASVTDLYSDAPGDFIPSSAGRNIEDYLRSVDYGISVGLQLYHNKNHNIFFRFVFDLSVSSLFKEDYIPESGDSKNTLKSFIVFFGIET